MLQLRRASREGIDVRLMPWLHDHHPAVTCEFSDRTDPGACIDREQCTEGFAPWPAGTEGVARRIRWTCFGPPLQASRHALLFGHQNGPALQEARGPRRAVTSVAILGQQSSALSALTE